MSAALVIENLSVHFRSGSETLAAVRDVSLAVEPAECVGIVGESGSGKTLVFTAVMGLLPANARAAGSVRFEGIDMLASSPSELNRVRGSKLTMIFQDPMTSLTPHLKIGVQLAEILVTHARLSWGEAQRAALKMLERVHIPDPARRLRQYPHELSGGMRQRVMIGMSLLCKPSLLIADEPTTALDVTVQAQIIDLLRAMRAQMRMATVLISHDLGVVAGMADRILVMYGGRIVESATSDELLRRAAHPYTAELLKCVPNLHGPRLDRMPSIAGATPGPGAEVGCAFAPRCARARDMCRTERPVLGAFGAAGLADASEATHALATRGAPAHHVACHFPLSI